MSDVDTRIGNDGESLANGLPIRIQDHFIRPGGSHWPQDLFARCFAGDGVVGKGVLEIFERLAVVAVLQGWRWLKRKSQAKRFKPEFLGSCACGPNQ